MIPVLAVEGLGLRFGAVTAVAGVSFTVEAGERVALIGPNGAGKTSILNCVSGVQRPSAGRVLLRGRDLAGLPPARRARLGVARTLQGLGLVDDLDVAANLLLGRHTSRAGRPADRQRCREVAASLGLDGVLGCRAGRLPASARKRVELGRALAADAGLLLLDEPFAAASPPDVELMARAIEGAAARGAAVVLVDHDLDTVLGLADRVVPLEGGRVAARVGP